MVIMIELWMMAIDLEWKIVYVGSAEDDRYDQVLDCIMVGPVPVGKSKFVYQVPSSHANVC